MQFLTTILMATSAMAVAIPSAPQGETLSLEKRESCMAKGGKVTKWTVTDFVYEAVYTHNTPTKTTNTGTVKFTLENSATSYKANCQAKSNKANDFFYGNTDFDCDVPLKGDSATFTYDRKSGKLGIFQHWSCAKEGGWYEAKGNANIKPKCNEKKWQNPHYKTGDKTYSSRRVTCEQKSFKVPILEISAVL
ncbi:hypothetical protein ACHAPJ_009882 [Fusarium lateritium]